MTRVEELTLKLADELISDAELVELNQLLAGDERAAAAHAGLLELEAALGGELAHIDMTKRTMQRIGQLRPDGRAKQPTGVELTAAKSTEAVPGEPKAGGGQSTVEADGDALGALRQAAQRSAAARRQPPARPSRWRPWLAAAAVLALGAAAVTITVQYLNQRGAGATVTTVAQLTMAQLTAAEGGVTLTRGQASTALAAEPGLALRAVDVLTVPAGAAAALSYPDGTRVDLAGGAVLAIAPSADGAEVADRPEGAAAPRGKALRLDAGTLSADVAPQPAGQPMVLTTAQARATVLGTRLTLTAGRTATRLQVTEGKVRLTRRSDATAVDVSAGHFAEAGRGVELVALPLPARAASDLLALYLFEEGQGAVVRDGSHVGRPLDLAIDGTDHARWLRGGGLAISAPGMLASATPARKIIDVCRASNALTIEAWVRPARASQNGPACIVSISRDESGPNVALSQGGDGATGTDYAVRLRTTGTTKPNDTTKTNDTGQPPLRTAEGIVQLRRTHLVFTRDSAGVGRLYVDGMLQAQHAFPGDLSNWATTCHLALGDEFTRDRPWLGEYHLVAIYGRALSADEVARNFHAGIRRNAR